MKPITFNKHKSLMKSDLDPVAESIYNEFTSELSKWINKNNNNNNSTNNSNNNNTIVKDLCGEYADFFIDKYFS